MRNPTTPLSKFVAPLCLLMIAIGFPSVAVAQDAKDQEIARLRQRIADLEAQVEGLRKTPAISTATLEAEENVKPGMNDSWRSEDIGPLIGRLETESREIFTERFKLAAVIGPPPGTVIADIGAEHDGGVPPGRQAVDAKFQAAERQGDGEQQMAVGEHPALARIEQG